LGRAWWPALAHAHACAADPHSTERDLALPRPSPAGRDAAVARRRTAVARRGREEPRAQLSRRVWTGEPDRPPSLRGRAERRCAARSRAARAQDLPRRGRTRAPGLAARALARRRRACADPVPAEVGLVAACLRAAGTRADPARSVPQDRDQAERRRRPDGPRRRLRRRDLE